MTLIAILAVIGALSVAGAIFWIAVALRGTARDLEDW
jgi:hypothetical protein